MGVVLRQPEQLDRLPARGRVSGEAYLRVVAADIPLAFSFGSLSSTKSNKDSSSSSSGRGSSSSNTGGATRTGSGVTPNYGGGRYYGGGATSPYRSGARSPLGIVGVPLAFGALAFYPGIWLYGAYAYPYGHVSLILILK